VRGGDDGFRLRHRLLVWWLLPAAPEGRRREPEARAGHGGKVRYELMTLTRDPAGATTDQLPVDARRAVIDRTDLSPARTRLLLLLAAGVGAALRLVNLGTLGLNSDEVVYAGQAAALAGNPVYVDTFPVFRAHPMLLQSLLS
jgi:hypothetical protein